MKIPDWLPVYGDTEHRDPKCRTEDAEHIEFFQHLKHLYPELHAIALHPQNGRKRSGAQISYDRKLGALNKGASDIIIPGAPCFVGEMKRADHTKSQWQPGQIEYLEAAAGAGAFVCVALGASAMLEAVEEWSKQLNR